jgi:hypothetical protein
MERLNQICDQYIYYMFSEYGSYGSLQLDELEEETVKSFLTEDRYTIDDWYNSHYSEESLFTSCLELMKIQHMLVNYYISFDILKNYAAIEYIEDYEMKILKDYIYYYIHSKPFDELKILIKTLIEENEQQEENEQVVEEEEENEQVVEQQEENEQVELINEDMFEEEEDFGETDSEEE